MLMFSDLTWTAPPKEIFLGDAFAAQVSNWVTHLDRYWKRRKRDVFRKMLLCLVSALKRSLAPLKKLLVKVCLRWQGDAQQKKSEKAKEAKAKCDSAHKTCWWSKKNIVMMCVLTLSYLINTIQSILKGTFSLFRTFVSSTAVKQKLLWPCRDSM